MVQQVWLSGCTPKMLAEPYTAWPAEWQNRRMFALSTAYVYASHERTAGEADRFLRRAAKTFRLQTGLETAKLLLIINDTHEEAVGAWDYEEIKQAMELAVKSASPAGEPNAKRSGKTRRRASPPGVSKALIPVIVEIARGVPRDVSRTKLVALGIPEVLAQSVYMAISLPTRALMRRHAHRAVSAFAKTRGPLERFTIRVLAPVIESLLVSAGSGARELWVQIAWTDAYSGWSRARKRRTNRMFVRRFLKEHPFLFRSLKAPSLENITKSDPWWADKPVQQPAP